MDKQTLKKHKRRKQNKVLEAHEKWSKSCHQNSKVDRNSEEEEEEEDNNNNNSNNANIND